jgi:hypothetical protein
LGGIGWVMPGMLVCAVAGAETAINANALAAAMTVLFTNPIPIKN